MTKNGEIMEETIEVQPETIKTKTKPAEIMDAEIVTEEKTASTMEKLEEIVAPMVNAEKTERVLPATWGMPGDPLTIKRRAARKRQRQARKLQRNLRKARKK